MTAAPKHAILRKIAASAPDLADGAERALGRSHAVVIYSVDLVRRLADDLRALAAGVESLLAENAELISARDTQDALLLQAFANNGKLSSLLDAAAGEKRAAGALRIRFTMTGELHPGLFFTRGLANAYVDDCSRQGIAAEIVEPGTTE